MNTLILKQKKMQHSLFHKMQSVGARLQLWMDRHHQRKQMASLDDDQLIDLGLDRKDVNLEMDKPFWK